MSFTAQIHPLERDKTQNLNHSLDKIFEGIPAGSSLPAVGRSVCLCQFHGTGDASIEICYGVNHYPNFDIVSRLKS